MAEKNVVREDVVSISFDIDDEGLKEINDMMKDLRKVIKDAAGDIDDVIDDISEEFDDIGDAAGEAAKDIEKGFGGAAQTIKDTGNEITKTAKEMARGAETASKSFKSKLAGGVSNVGGKITQTASKFKNFVNTKFDNLINSLSRFNRKADESTEKVGKLAKESGGIGSGIKGTVAKAAGAVAVGATAKNVISTGMNFESGMSNVKAVSGANDAEMEKLTEKAKEMGATTVFSASESAEAMNYMAMAGWKSEQMIGGIEGIMNLAAASGEDLGTTSDIVTDALTAFGMKAEDSGRFADVLAVASSNANTNVSMMGETFKYTAASAGAMGYKCEDIAVAIGLMANAGIKSSQSGTALNSVITRMAKPTKESSMAMKKLGLNLQDSKGNMKSFQEIMVDMRKGFKGLDKDEKAAYAAMLAGKNAMSGLLAVVNASDDDFNKLTKAINNSTGAAKEMADIKNDNLLGQLTLLKSGIEGFMIDIYDVIKTPLKGAVKWISEKFLPNIVSGFGKLTKTLSPIFEKISPIVKRVIDNVSKNFEWFKTNILPSLIEGFNTIKSAVIPVIQAITQKAAGLFDRIFGLIMRNKDTILSAWNSICGLFTHFSDSILPELVNVFNWAVQTAAPIISDVINIICETVNSAVPFVKEAIGYVISIIKGISPIVKGIANIISSTVRGISKNMSKIIPVLKIAAKGYIAVKAAVFAYNGVASAANIILKAHKMWLMAVNTAETAYLTTLYAVETATKMVNAVIAAGPWGWAAMAIGIATVALSGFIISLDDTDEYLAKNQEELKKTASEVVTLQEVLKKTTVQPIQFDKLITSDGFTFDDINKQIDKAEEGISQILKTRFAEQQALRNEDIKNIQEYKNKITELEKKKFDVYADQMTAQKTAIELLKPGDKNAVGDAMAYLNNAETIKTEALKEADKLYQQRLAEINNMYQKNDKIIDDKGITHYKDKELETAKKAFENRRKLIEEQYKLTSESVEKLSSDIIKKEEGFWKEAEKVANMPVYSGMQIAGHQKEIDSGNAFKKSSQKEKAYSDSLIKINSDTISSINQVLGLSATLKERNGEISQTLKDNVSAFLKPYDGLNDDMQEIAKDTVLGFVAGLENQIPGLSDTSTMSAQEIVDTIKSYLGIHSPSIVMREIGMYTIQGFQNGILIQSIPLIMTLMTISSNIRKVFENIKLDFIGKNIVSGLRNGIINQKGKLLTEVKGMARDINNAFKTELDIHSPSRVMRQNGQMVGEGLVLGMKDKTSDIQASFNNLNTDMSMGYTPENSVMNSSNSTHTETNNINPNINVYINGGNEETAAQTKYALEELFEEMFAGYSRKSPRVTEV